MVGDGKSGTATTALLAKLVQNISGKKNIAKELALAEKIIYEGKYSTQSPQDVTRKYSGLAEKFEIFGYSDKAERLEEIFNAAVYSCPSRDLSAKLLVHNVLWLTFLLADSPTSNKGEFTFSWSDTLNAAGEITWDQVLDNEPLNGDHWKLPDLDEDDSDADDTDYEWHGSTNVTSALDASTAINTDAPITSTDYAQPIPDAFHTWQYWRDSSSPSVFSSGNRTPIAVQISIQRHRDSLKSAFLFPRKLHTIHEMDVVKEALFMLNPQASVILEDLRGRSLFVFIPDSAKYQVSTELCMLHTSLGSQTHLLQELAALGTSLHRLRIVSESLLNNGIKRDIPQTFESCATAMVEFVFRPFQLYIVELTAAVFSSSPGLGTVLHLAYKLQAWTRIISALNPILVVLYQFMLCSGIETSSCACEVKEHSNKSRVAVLLSKLFRELCRQQLYDGVHGITAFEMMLNIFLLTVQPYFEFTDQLMTVGAISDPQLEYFIESRQLQLDDLHVLPESAPTFLGAFVGTVISCGQSVLLMKHLNRYISHVNTTEAIGFCSLFDAVKTRVLELFDISVAKDAQTMTEGSLISSFSNGTADFVSKEGQTFVLLAKLRGEMPTRDPALTVTDPVIPTFHDALHDILESMFREMNVYVGKLLSTALLGSNIGGGPGRQSKSYLIRKAHEIHGVYFMLDGALYELFTQRFFTLIESKPIVGRARFYAHDRQLNLIFRETALSLGRFEECSGDVPMIDPRAIKFFTYERKESDPLSSHKRIWDLVERLDNSSPHYSAFVYFARMACRIEVESPYTVIFSPNSANSILDDVHSLLMSVKYVRFTSLKTWKRWISLDRTGSFQEHGRQDESFISTRRRISAMQMSLNHFISCVHNHFLGIANKHSSEYIDILRQSRTIEEMRLQHLACVTGVREKLLLGRKTLPILAAMFAVFSLASDFGDLLEKLEKKVDGNMERVAVGEVLHAMENKYTEHRRFVVESLASLENYGVNFGASLISVI
ncbi:Spc98 family-domain-containing protein [Cladochytrium replicatum]|nr:Spc98 family-domain-containing protein [Cladochytrium replicatum]